MLSYWPVIILYLTWVITTADVISKCYGKNSTIRAIWLPPIHHPNYKLFCRTEHKAGNQLYRSTGNSSLHAVVHVDHSIITSNVGSSTPVTVSNKYNLHKFSSEDLEIQTLVNRWILHAGYEWEFLQDEQLSSPNGCVWEPTIRWRDFLFVICMQIVQLVEWTARWPRLFLLHHTFIHLLDPVA